jgi:hypothetical protein
LGILGKFKASFGLHCWLNLMAMAQGMGTIKKGLGNAQKSPN